MRSVPFFVPVRRNTVAAFLERGETPEGPAELAALYVLALVRKTPSMVRNQVERALFETQDLMLDDPSKGAVVVQAIWASMAPIAIDDLEDALAERHLIFAPSSRSPFPDEPIERYDSSFQDECRVPLQSIELDVLPMGSDEDDDGYDEYERPSAPAVTLTGTREQTLAANTIIAMLDEHIELDAYAGTGKTHLIMALASQAPGFFTYVTPYRSHMHGGMAAADAWRVSGLRTRTLFELAQEAARHRVAALGLRPLKLGDGEVPPDERAARAGIKSIGPHSAAQVLGLAERAINVWSESDSLHVQVQHFRRLLPGMPEASLPPYIAAADALWQAMWRPNQKTRAFNLRLSHIAKWLALSGIDLPPGLGTLLVDEAHDLMPSWRQLLDRYPEGCVFLGDPYQRLTGRVVRHQRNKMLAMNRSFRMGMNGEGAIQKTLAGAPEQRAFDPFLGSRDHITRVRHWRGRGRALQDGLRVYVNEWSLLEDAQRLKLEGARFRLLPASARKLGELVTGAVALINQREADWQRHAGGFRSWEDFAAALERDGREQVIRLFERGYNTARFQEMLAAQAPEGEQRITLGLVAHVKNLQSSAVALNECCFTEAQLRHGYVPAHAAYLAMSRVRDELWLPGDAFDRLVDLKRAEVAMT
jgi:hypothetical protein